MEEERILPDTAHSSGKESYLSDQVPLFVVLIRLSQLLGTTTELVRSGRLWEKAREPLHLILESLDLIMQVIYYQEAERKVCEYQCYSRGSWSGEQLSFLFPHALLAQEFHWHAECYGAV